MGHDFYELFYRFIENMKVLNRASETIKNYSLHVKEFQKKTRITDLREVSRQTLEDYALTLKNYRSENGEPYKPFTISCKLRAIKRFFEYLTKENIIFTNPSEQIKEPKRDRRLPKPILTTKEASLILDKPNLGTLKGIRDRAVLETFYSTGIRINEISRLTIYDADLKAGLLRINNGKGSKDRVVPMGKHTIRYIREYIEKVRPRYTRHNRSQRILFVNAHGCPLNKQVISIFIRDYAKQTGIKKRVTAHTFRHTFAAELIKNGADITAVQKMMGHASLRTTEDYIRLAGVDVKKNHQKSHPREKDRESSEDIKPRITRKRPRYDYKRNNKNPA